MVGSGLTYGVAINSLAVAPPVGTSANHFPSSAAPKSSTNGGITLCGAGVTQTLTSKIGILAVGGNVTVCNGAVLTVKNTVLMVQSFTATKNTSLAGDLAYRYHVNVTGGAQLRLVNASINTSAASFDAFPKLNLTVDSSSMVMVEDGSLAFAGSIYVTGGSTLFVNNSRIGPNSVAPSSPANFTGDNRYAPQITVEGGSNLVTVNSSIVNYYKDSDALTSALDENFVSSQVQTGAVSTTAVVKGLMPPNSQALVQDTYSSWSGATISFVLNDTATGTVTPTFHYNGHAQAGLPVNLGIGNTTTFNMSIPSTFLASYVNPGGLSGLLTAMQAGTANVTFASGGGAGTIKSLLLSMVPIFGFNITVGGASHLYAVDSQIDVNWGNATCELPYQSNKLYLSGGSTGDLLNTSAITSWGTATAPSCGNVNAFEVDATSSYWVYNWVQVSTIGTSGSPVPDTMLSAVSGVTNKTVAALATSATNPASFAPYFLGAVVARAVPAGSPYGYGNTTASGMANYALATSYVTQGSLADGLYVGGLYNISFQEKVNYINGTSTTLNTGITSTPQMCSWPYITASCAFTALTPVVLPLFTADIQLTAMTVETQGVTCGVSCNLFEGDSVLVNLTVVDTNGITISGGLSVPIYLYDEYGTIQNVSGPSYVSFTAGSSATQTFSFTFTVPFHSSGPHTLVAMVDPMHLFPENGTAGKTFVTTYTALKSPQILSSTTTVQIIDACTGQAITLPQSNTCNRVSIQASAINTGDANVNVTITFLWNGNLSQPIGQPIHKLMPVSTLVTVNTSMLITYANNLGFVQVNIQSPANLPPISYPPVNAQVSQNVNLEDFTTLQLVNASKDFVVQTQGGQGNYYTVNNATGLNPATSPFGIGTSLSVSANLTNVGGPTNNANATLYMEASNNKSWIPVSVFSTGPVAGGPSSVSVVMPAWHISPALIGSSLGYRAFNLTLTWTNTYSYGTATFSLNHHFAIQVRAPQIVVTTNFHPVTYTVGETATLTIGGSVTFAALSNETANMAVHLFDPNSGLNCSARVLTADVTNGTSPLPSFLLPSVCLTAGTYNIVLQFTYLGNVTWVKQLPSMITVKEQAVAQQSFLQQYLWYIIIAVIAVAVVLVIFFVFRRMGRGNLVECGECGELIPESALACPKCGAEFERELMRCSRCGASIPADSKVCPDCSALLVGTKPDALASDYIAFTQRFRVLAQKELAENYNEGAFWDWWKRQPTYIPFATWKQQMAVSGAAGGSAPAAAAAKDKGKKGRGGAPPSSGGLPPGGGPTGPGPSARGAQTPPQGMTEAPPSEGGSRAEAGMRACPSCGRNINESMLLCPFCGTATR